MEVSKTALAVALSCGFLFGCDFDVGPDADGGTTNTSTPASPLSGAYWDIGDASSASAASTRSVDLPNVYVFDGTNQRYYDDDATRGIYEIKTTPYTDNIEAGTVTFTYYDASGAETEVTGTYTVVEGVLTIDETSFGTLTGTDKTTNASIKAAVEAANSAAGFNNLVQILDTKDDDTGELRLKLADSSTGVAVDQIASGKVTVDLIYQKHADTQQAEDDNGNNAYITLYASGTGNAQLYGEAVFNNGEIFYRSNTIVDGKPQLSAAIGTYTLGEDLAVEIEWGNDEYSFSVNSTAYGPFKYAADNTPIQVIALKMGDNSNTTHFELLADNFKVYNIDGANEELVFDDNFDGYAIGQSLSGDPYNSNSSEAVVVNATGEAAPEESDEAEDDTPVDPSDFPAPINQYQFSAASLSDSGSAANDISINGTDAQFTSAAGADGTSDTAGYLDQDAAFSYLKVSSPSGAQSITGSFSVEAVIKQTQRLDSTYYGDDVSLFEYYDKDSDNADWETGFKFYIEGDDATAANLNAIKMKMYCGDSNSEAKTSGLAMANDQWQHLMAVYDSSASQVKLYINGEELTTKDLGCTPLVNGNAEDYVSMLGGSTSSDKNFNGFADNIALWDVALTADQVAERAAEFGLETIN
ncbi:LamG domain-containing protein [Vibrio gallicus]|uniref:LamG domain-containing protein n=1 Tax=Vibrio gallicus TaxID=190897 RepID=UPI0021C47878|nr:LamG domain-containing protein [Vibrio gallicus]